MATLQRESDVAATREAVVAGLSAYNAARVGPRNSEPLALSLRDDDGVIVGGLIGELKWEWLHIDLLWIDDVIRQVVVDLVVGQKALLLALGD